MYVSAPSLPIDPSPLRVKVILTTETSSYALKAKQQLPDNCPLFFQNFLGFSCMFHFQINFRIFGVCFGKKKRNCVGIVTRIILSLHANGKN